MVEEQTSSAHRTKPDRQTITRKACGAIVGVVFLGASVALTGSMQLAATDQERRDIGGALSDALSFFDEAAPFVKLLNVLGPWSGVIDGVASAVYNRIVYVANHRSGVPAAAPVDRRPHPHQGGNGRAPLPEDNDIVAPDPAGGYRG